VKTLFWTVIGAIALHVALTGPWVADAGRAVRAQTVVSATPVGR